MIDAPIHFHPDAVLEVEHALDWYARRSQQAAELFQRELEAAVGVVISAPLRWQKYDGETRRLSLGRFPYFLVYRFDAGLVEVLAVAHGRRRPGYWRDRIAG